MLLSDEIREDFGDYLEESCLDWLDDNKHEMAVLYRGEIIDSINNLPPEIEPADICIRAPIMLFVSEEFGRIHKTFERKKVFVRSLAILQDRDYPTGSLKPNSRD